MLCLAAFLSANAGCQRMATTTPAGAPPADRNPDLAVGSQPAAACPSPSTIAPASPTSDDELCKVIPPIPLPGIELGSYRIGTLLAELKGECKESDSMADCEYIDPAGVTYGVGAGHVISVRAVREKSGSLALPLNLHWGDSMDATLRSLLATTRSGWIAQAATADTIYLSSSQRYRGQGVNYIVRLDFVDGKLSAVNFHVLDS